MKSYINTLGLRNQPDSQLFQNLSRNQDRDKERNLFRCMQVLLAAGALILTGCLGPIALHKAVLEYDETVQRLESEIHC